MRLFSSLAVAVAAAAISIGFAGAASAQAINSPWAVGVTAGSDGLGADLKYALSRSFVLRARGTFLDVNHNENSDGVHYSGKAKLQTGGAFLDWHPFASPFLVSAGVLGGKRQIDLNGSSQNNVTFNGDVYTPAQLGTVYGRAKLPSTSGFLGLGFDNTYTHNGPIGFNILAGAQFGGSPKVHLAATGLAATTPQFQTDLAEEENDIRHDLNFAKVYPAISVGLSYRF